jgi:hypothetical protein
VLAHGLLGLRQHCGRASRISPGHPEAGEKHFTDHISVNRFVKLPCQLEALLAVLLSRTEIVPFVREAGQAKIRIAGTRGRLPTEQLQGAPVGRGRRVELVLHFLELAQADCNQTGVASIP